MATWTLTTQHKKNAIERSIWTKDHGPLQLENSETGEQFQGEPDE